METTETTEDLVLDLNQLGEGTFESPPSSSPTTPYGGSAEWEQLSSGEQSTEFEVLTGYNRVPIYERRAQWLAEQQAKREKAKLQGFPKGIKSNGLPTFQPNPQLPFPITAQFLRSYGGGDRFPWEKRRPQNDDSQRTVVAPLNNMYTPETTSSPAPSYHSTPASSPGSPDEMPIVSPFTHTTEKGKPRPEMPSRKTSGIPSFTSLFESKRNRDRNSRPKRDNPPPMPTRKTSTLGFPGLEIEHKSKLEMMLPKSANQTAFRLGCFFGLGRAAFLLLLIASSSILALFSVVSSPYFTALNQYKTTYPSHASFIDFPTLMSIEISLENIIESATGGSALARLLKEGEMIVNDLGTVVKHSDLSCSKTLGGKLDRFAADAREGVSALQMFETNVGEVFDQLLGANQKFLGEFAELQQRGRYISMPFISKKSNTEHTTTQLSANYKKTAHLLESNIEVLISTGESIIASLDALCQQHHPIYDEIVREFVSIERQEGSPWVRIGWESPGASVVRKTKMRESQALLAAVGSYEEKARGYVENIHLELETMVGEMRNLQRRVSRVLVNIGNDNTGVDYSVEISLERQVEAVEEAVGVMIRRRTQKTRVCHVSTVENRLRARNDTGSYMGSFTPTRTSST
ncbi:uncharacterized protein H6S33_013045 [Morchella sextelata]|uniref:uncharacterized protein n=1 Tax=Morchella sextelata TaxID=1174677 RepID=UPI001D054E6B|nr:uncharacterized protein H6S33_013045 [Morchella sextelata]KAH0609559.1 hypothetical protein H6S33_013045 [Morchella sextelata]